MRRLLSSFALAALLCAPALAQAQSYTFGNVGTLTTKLGGIFTSGQFGAVGDGAHDDTPNLQAGATAAIGGTLRITRGTFRLTGHIVLNSNTAVVCDRSVLQQTTPGELVFYGANVSKVEIHGCIMQTAAPATSATPPIVGTGTNCGAICFETSGGSIVVERNIISGFFNGIVGTNLVGFTVRDNEISHWRLYAVMASQSSEFHVDGNRLHDNDNTVAALPWSSATTYALGDMATSGGLLYYSAQAGNLNNVPPDPNSNAFWLRSFATYGVMATGNRGVVWQARNTISLNKIFNNPAWDGIMSHDCDGLVISGNDIRNVRNGIDLSGSGTGKFDEKILISTNYIEDTAVDIWTGVAARNCGVILFSPAPSDVTGSILARNAAITGNVINGFNRFASGSNATGAVCLSNTQGVVVSGNQITNTQNFVGNPAGGIIANATGNGLVISGNSIDTVAGLSPIRLNALTSDRVSVTGNVLSDGNGSAIALNVASASAITFLAAKGNVWNATTPYAVNGTVTTQRTDFSSGTITLASGTGTATVVVGSRCVCTDSTAAAAVKCSVAATTLTANGTGTDVVAYECF